jgi:hypothetical protein
MGYSDAGFCEEAGREDMIEVTACAVCVLGAVGFETAACGTAEKVTKGGRLKSGGVLIAPPAADVILLSGSVIDLDVVAV